MNYFNLYLLLAYALKKYFYRNHIHSVAMVDLMQHSCVMIQLRQVGVRVQDYINKIPQRAQHGGFHRRAVGKSQMSKKNSNTIFPQPPSPRQESKLIFEYILYCRYKTQSLRSDSSPTGGYGSDTPEPSSAQSPDASRGGVVWAVTDLASVPKGSLIIDPQTLQPILNQDG